MKQFYNRILFSFILLVSLLASINVFADGSRDLYPNNAPGKRATLISNNNALYTEAYPFMNRGVHKVYAKVGEKLYIGHSGQGMGVAGTIRVFRPTTVINGTRSNSDFNSGNSTTVGRINNRAEEKLGPNINGTVAGGFTPFEVTVDVEGVWEIDLISPGGTTDYGSTGAGSSPGNNGAYKGLANANWTQDTNTPSISAWDVTVANGNTPIRGRVYINIFNAYIESDFTTGNGFYGKFNVLTKDGFPYEVDNNGMMGVAFTFFVNNRGFTTAANGQGTRTFKSQTSSATAFVKNPNDSDDANNLNITHKLFYTTPASDLPATAVYAGAANSTWLKLNNPPDPEATQIKFTGVEGSQNYASSKGAIISFEANVVGNYKITIPGGVTGGVTYYPRVLYGSTVFGANSVTWDGKTGTQANPLVAAGPIPPGSTIGSITVQLLGAEVHFPFLDMESNANGIKIIQTDKNTYTVPASGADVVYWDDSNITTNANQTASSPNVVPTGGTGQPSRTNGHIWGANNDPAGASEYGDARAMDTYSFVPGPITNVALGVTIKQADLEIVSITKDKTTAVVGEEITYTVVVRNNSSTTSVSDVEKATFRFDYPNGFNVTSVVKSAITGTVTAEPGATTGATQFKELLNMTSGSQFTYTIKGTAGQALKGTTLNSTSSITRPNDVTDPDATSPTLPFSDNAQTECDGDGVGCNNIKSPAGVTITNSPPVGVPNVSSTNMNTLLTVADGATGTAGDLLVNDTDVDGDVLVVTKFTVAGSAGDKTLGGGGFLIPGQGTIIINANGSYSFNPVTNFTGAVNTITYTLSDGTATTTTTLNITVNATNSAPTGVANTNTVAEDVTLTVVDGAAGVTGDLLVNDTDPENDVLTITKFTVAGFVGDKAVATPFVITNVGTITINANGSYTFVPVANYHGAVPQITYTLSDGSLTATTTLDITVTPVNDVPVLVANTNTVAEDVTLTVIDGATGVTGDILVNDTDVDGDALTVTKFTVAGFVGDKAVGTPFVITNVGTITINANGSYTFVPVANYNGNVPQITYTATDGTATATSTLDITVTPVNDIPVLVANTNTVAEDVTLTVIDGATGVTGDILVNDTDVDGDLLTVTKFTVAGFVGDKAVGTPFLITNVGTITINANGSYTFVPVANYNGNVPQITYTATDGTATATSTLDITVTPVNDAPVAFANTGNTNEDVTLTVIDGATGVTGDILVNDTDIDGDALTVASYTIAGVAGTQTVGTPVVMTGVGTININANGAYTFVPAANYNGAVPVITYTATDGTATATATLTITINPINDAPVLVANTNTVAEDVTLTVIDGATGVTGDILVNDTDVDGDLLTVTKFTVAGFVGDKAVGTPFVITNVGTITINANGSYTFVPVANYNGNVPQITYTATDGTATATSTLDITVTPVNDIPVLVANTNTVAEDVTLTVIDGATGVTGDILVNDSDVDGDLLTVTKFTVAGFVGDKAVGTPFLITNVGTITINANGSYTFVPVANYNGNVPQITYTATDGTATATSTLDITVTPVNDAPVAFANTGNTNEDVTLTVIDGATGVTGDILVNDTDIDGDALTVASYTIAGVAGTQTVGTPVVMTGVGTININANGAYTFVPAANYNGAVPVITYTATDGTATATATLTITINPINDAPVLVANTNTVAEDVTLTVIDGATGVTGDILVNDSDVDGDLLTVTKFTVAGFVGDKAVGTPFLITNVGTITISANGSYTFVPVANYNGNVPQITYTATDGTATATSTLDITVTPVNDIPVLVANTNTVAEDVTLTVIDGATGVTGDILVNDTDVDGDLLTVTKFTVAGFVGDKAVGTPFLITNVGTITINANGSYTFVPVANYNGNVPQITYTATDGTATATSTLDITVTPVNDAPVAFANTGNTNEDVTLTVIDGATGVTGDILVNDTDIDGDALTVASYTIAGVAGTQTVGTPVVMTGVGTITINANGAYTFVPAANYNGAVPVITYTATDGTATATATLTITINPINDAPVAFANTNTTLEDNNLTVIDGATGITGDILVNDTDIENDVLTVASYTIAGVVGTQTVGTPVIITNVGTITINANGSYAFEPALNFNGAVPVITYTVSDGNSGTATSTLTIGVTPVNDIPSFTKGADQVVSIGAATQTVSAWATGISKGPANENAQNVDFVATNDKNTLFTTQPAISPAGVLTYTPAPGQYGKATVTVYIHDDGGTTNGGVDQSATQTFVITVKPVGTADTDITPINTSTTTIVTANDGPSGVGTAVIPGGTNPTNGSITINPDKSITYTPNNGYVGTDTYTYILETPDGVKSDPITLTISVYDPKITLAKEGTYNDFNANGKVDAGDRINYTFIVTNTGTVPVTNITITDANATIAGGPILSLAVAGVDNSTFTGFHTLTQAEIDNGGVFNLATATGKDPKNNNVTTTSNDPTPLVPSDPNYPVTPPTPACPTCTVTPVVQTGAMTLAKEGVYNDFNADGKVSVGDRINYTFVVTNTGNVTLTNVTITDPDAIITGGPIATLAVGASNTNTFTGYHVLTQADIDNSGVYNLATAKAKDPKNKDITTTSNDPTPLAPGDPNYPVTPPTPACPTCTITPIVQTGALSLLKDGTYNDFNADGKVSVGDRINYTFVVTNTGNVTLTNVTVSDPNATISGGPIATLAVGASNNNTFTGFHTLTQADIDNSGVYNLATATGKDPKNKDITTTSNDPTPLAPGDPNYPVTPPTPACPTCTITPLVQAPSLSLTKEGTYNDFNADGKVNVGDRINYVFVVTNTGNVTLTNVTITDPAAVITGGPIASFAPGAINNNTFTGYHILTQADIDNSGVYNLATATGKDPKNNNITTTSNDPTPLAPGDPNYPVTPPTPACPTCTITPIVQTGSMSLTKEGTYNDFNADGKVSVGDRINYVFVVTNTGNVTLTNVNITDNNALVTGGPIVSLAAGASNNSTFTGYHVLTQADIDNSGVYNLATATAKDPKNKDITTTSNDPTPLAPGDPNYPVTPPTPACPTCTITPIVQIGAMTLAKDGTYNDFNADGKVNVGDRINYTFRVTNTGNVTLKNITISDPDATIAGGPIATLVVGAFDATTFTGYHTLTQADIDRSGVYNLATVNGFDPKNKPVTATSNDPTPLQPTDPGYPVLPPVTPCATCTVTPLPQSPSMRIAKEGTFVDSNADGIANVGEVINYAFTVYNTGNVTLSNIIITDNNAVVTGGPLATLAVGASNNTTFTAVHTLTQADIDNGGVFNVATGNAKDPKGNDIPPTKSDDPTPIPPTDPSYPVTPPVTPCPTCTVTPIVQLPKMTLAKDGAYFDFNADGKINAGDRINYTFVVKNTGNVTLTNVTISDANATIAGGPITSLAVGATDNTTFTGFHTLTTADLDNGGVFNVATATAKDPKGNEVTTPSNDPTPLLPTDPTYPINPPTPACPTCTVTPIVQTGAMTLAKDGTYFDFNGDGKANAGDRINYTFVVRNTGNVTLKNITITDANAVINGGPIVTLAAGGVDNTTFTGYHVLTAADFNNAGVFNVAIVKGTDPRGNEITTPSDDPTPLLPTDPTYPINPPVTPCPTCTVTPLPQTPSMRIVKDGTYVDTNGDGVANIGDRINYTFNVINTGNVAITNIIITDNNATVTGGPIAVLAAGANDNTTFTAFHVLTQADIDNGGVFNVATATGKDPKGNDVPPTTSDDPTPIPPTDPNYPVNPPVTPCPTCTVTPIVQNPSMRLVKDGAYADTNADGKVNIGDRINYTFNVINTGNVTIKNITITDANAVVSGGPIVALLPGANNNTTFTAYHVLTQADIDNGGVFNVAIATGKDPKGNDVTTPSNDPTPLPPTDPTYPVTPPVTPCPTCTVTPIVQEGKLSLFKDGAYADTNSDGIVNVGDRINYTFIVTNIGNVTLTNITVTDPNAVMSGGPIASLAVGAQNNNTFTGYHILTQADIDNGGVFNLATAKGKDPKNKDITTTSNDPTPLVPGSPTYPVTPPTPACPTCTVTPTVQTPNMTLTKDGVYADTNGDGVVNIGDRVNYTFTVTNTGNVTLTNIVITDPNATMVGGPLATLAPGAINSTTFTGYHVLTQADIDNRGVFNLATATAKDPRGNTITKTSTDPTPLAPTSPQYPIVPPVPACPTCTVTPIAQTGAVALVKTVTNTGTGVNGAFVLGNSIQYTFTITNTGNVSLSNITLVDAKLATGTINVAGTLLPGASTTVIRTYTITAADIIAGKVTNTATVNATTPAGATVTDVSGSTTTNNTPTVTGLGIPPVATNDSATTPQNNAVKITIQTNDVAGSTPIVVGSVVITVQPLHGTVIVNADGTVTYTPTTGYVGPDTFTYTVKDTNGQTSNPAVVAITVTPSVPKATNDNATTTFSKPVIIPIIANDIKDVAPFDLTTIEIVSQPLNGTVKINSDGTVTYTPNDGYTGTEIFTYRLKDTYGNYTNIATVTVLVDGTFFGNVITPDGDGKNDVWKIVGANNYDRIEVEFFNRWGNQVYINKNYKNDWNGERLNEGTYYYTARLYKGSTYTTVKGWVLVKR